MLKQVNITRSNVTIDDRRAVAVTAAARKNNEVAKVSHENFIRNALKDRLGWPRQYAAPEGLKVAAREMAAKLIERDRQNFKQVPASVEEVCQ